MLSKVSIREVASGYCRLYRKADRCERGRILDYFVALTGYHRKYAIHLINHPPQARPKVSRRRKRTYTATFTAILVLIWQTCGHICSKRLKPFLPEMASVLAQKGYVQLSEQDRGLLSVVGRGTIDRLLAPYRQRRPHGRSTTKPGSLLKKAIPVRTFADWHEDRPGFLEIDLVAHCGPTASGDYLCTLNAVDIATGWSECVAPANRGQHAVGEALQRLRQRLPFPLLGIDSDNDSSFINDILLRYCQAAKITFTRSRPYKKNDQAHVEQKNWTIVRQLIGYDRYESPSAVGPFNALYRELRLYTNFFQPVLKLKERTRVDGKVKKVYDEAQTPYQRVMASPHTTADDKDRLTELYRTLDPVALRRGIDLRCRELWDRLRVR